ETFESNSVAVVGTVDAHVRGSRSSCREKIYRLQRLLLLVGHHDTKAVRDAEDPAEIAAHVYKLLAVLLCQEVGVAARVDVEAVRGGVGNRLRPGPSRNGEELLARVAHLGAAAPPVQRSRHRRQRDG